MPSSIRKNSIMMVLYEILSLIVPLVLTPYLSRVIGAMGIGIYSYSFSIVSYFIIFVQLGVKLYGRREIAKVNDDRRKYSSVFWEILTIQSLLLLITSVAYGGFVKAFMADVVLKKALIIQLLELLVGYLDISWFFYGIEKFRVIVIRNAVVRLLEVILIFIFVCDANHIIDYVFIMALCNLLGVLMMWVSLKNILKFVKPSFKKILCHIKPLFILAIPVLSTQLFSIVDKTIIGYFLSMDDVGEYENAYKIAKIPVVIITALGSVMLSRVTKLLADGKTEEGLRYISKSFILVMFISYAISFIMSSVSPIFIPWFLGNDFVKSIPLLQILSFMIIFIGCGNVLRTQYMLPRGYDKLYTKSVIYGSCCNIILSFLLIKSFGVIGVAIASLLGEVIICIYSSIKMRKEIPIFSFIKTTYIYFISGVVMFCEVKLLILFLESFINNSFITIITVIILGLLLYLLNTVVLEHLIKQQVITNELCLVLKNKSNVSNE